MQILSLKIENFRSIRKCRFYPGKLNVLLGPNNSGKTAVLEAINLLLNPEFSLRSGAIDENDFYNREYLPKQSTIPSVNVGLDSARAEPTLTSSETIQSESAFVHAPAPRIQIEALLGPVTDPDDQAEFRDFLVPWDSESKTIVEAAQEGEDPYRAGTCKPAIYVAFEAFYYAPEDEFIWRTYFKRQADTSWDPEDDSNCPTVNRHHKLRIGFLIYRDLRALQRPLTLEPSSLLTRVLKSQSASPTNFESALQSTEKALSSLQISPDLGRVLNELRNELKAFLPLGSSGSERLDFDLTDRTRSQFKANAQVYIDGKIRLPLQKFGAGTRSLATLSLLTYIMRKRNRGILALEEPETFLFPHAQRRVIDESKSLATQMFVTTHSPFVLERFDVENIARVHADGAGILAIRYLDPKIAKSDLFKRHLKKTLAEAMFSNAAIVFEEQSMSRWISALSECLAGQEIDGVKIQSFDLAGVAALTAEGNGDVIPIARFIEGAGIPALVCLDNTKKTKSMLEWESEKKPAIFLAQKGLEKLLVEELPPTLLKKFVTAPEGTHGDSVDIATYEASDATEQARLATEFLIRNKGSLSFQEWMLSHITATSIPKTFSALLVEAMKLLPAHVEEPQTSEPTTAADTGQMTTQAQEDTSASHVIPSN